MTKEEIDGIKIEHRGDQKYWHITMFVVPLRENRSIPRCADLIAAAKDILCKVKGLGKEWYATNAEVMAWSNHSDRGILVPSRFRVSLDMMTEGMET